MVTWDAIKCLTLCLAHGRQLRNPTLPSILLFCSNCYTSWCSVQSLSRVRLLATPWTAAHQASDLFVLEEHKIHLPDWVLLWTEKAYYILSLTYMYTTPQEKHITSRVLCEYLYVNDTPYASYQLKFTPANSWTTEYWNELQCSPSWNLLQGLFLTKGSNLCLLCLIHR